MLMIFQLYGLLRVTEIATLLMKGEENRPLR
ncbi:hypothetical protein SAMN05216588_1383 [Pseudomonas flavescens]|uniref:Uncharacterized protein n=1 Tax=Phytopseudomonas flavescens TaxID=29435 RepID=A0A1G8QP36_9GAMM|nr:hypothetical protein SAMN05216588_1383 [Pseudomonas flavescens]